MNSTTIKLQPQQPTFNITSTNNKFYYDTTNYRLYNYVDGYEHIQYDHQSMLELIPIEEVERFLRKKKLENIQRDV